jgi:integrase
VRRAQIAQGKFDMMSLEPALTFEGLAKPYLEYAKANKKSWQRDRTSLNSLLPFFGSKRLKNISPFMVEKYKQQRRGKVSAASVNRELACMKHMFNLAIKWGKVSKNPVREVKLFKEKNRRLRFLSEEEADRLVNACNAQLKPVVITALETGMRLGEILKLKWNDIDFERNLVMLDETKSGSPRQIPLSDELREMFIDMKSRSTQEYVFLNKQGKPFRDIRESFERAKKKARINNFRFHDLRHTFASHLVMAGIDLVTVKELLGHKTIQMTMRYSHLSGKHKQQAINILQRRLRHEHYMDTREKKESSAMKDKY